jgi:predicted Zn-dependent peptidase
VAVGSADLIGGGCVGAQIDEEKARAALGYKSRSGCATAALTDAVHEAAYGEATAYGSNGYALNLKKLSVDEVLAYRQAHFVRENLTVVTHGGITGEAVKKIVGVHLSQFPTKGGNKGVTLPAASFVGGEVKIRADLDGKTHLAIAFPSPAGEAGKAYQVLAGVLNARAAAQGICAGAFTHSYHHGGLVGVRASGCVTSASEQLKKVVAELKAIANGAAAETDVVKTQLSLKNALNVEAGNESATAVLLSGVNAADVRGVTSAAVVDAAKAVLKTASPAFAVYGATAGVGSVQKFLA